MTEVRPVPFAPGYFVSTEGEVFSEKRGIRRAMKPWSKSGYASVSLCASGQTAKVYIHRLVALVFIGSPASADHEVRHLDGVPAHCHVGNLAWGTHTENMRDMVRHGRQGAYRHPDRMPRGNRHGSKTKPDSTPRGERSGTSKITENQARQVRVEHSATGNISEAARRAGVPRGAAKCIIQGKTWKHVS